MKLVICVLALNEIEWLPRFYLQHKDFPCVEKFIFVEAADIIYAQTNRDMVSDEGLSTDGTTDILQQMAKFDERVVHIKHGFTSHENPAQGKVAARQAYLDEIERLNIEPDYILPIDADEMWPKQSQKDAVALFEQRKPHDGYIFNMRTIWHPPSVADQPLLRWEALGSVFKVPAARAWRWERGMAYKGHNNPSYKTEYGAYLPSRNFYRADLKDKHIQWLHMGFASKAKNRIAKNRYYVARGEGVTDHRQKYVDARAAFETWQLGDRMPTGCRVVPYLGSVPECFEDK